MRPLSHAFLCTRFLYYPSYFHSGYIEVTPAATSVYYHLHASSHYLYSALRSLLTSYARERDLYPLLLLLAGHQIPIVRTSYIRIPPGPPLVRWHWPVQFFFVPLAALADRRYLFFSRISSPQNVVLS